jgi:hypothetical protein
MKKHNFKKTVTQGGSLMIEALAMLGLIAVVTPTMYKKSAERTMEVDDINTATTMRTYMNAAEAYVKANYTNIIKDMPDDATGVKEVSGDDLKNYLPYNFNVTTSLYSYDTPKIRVVKAKDSANLTTFVLFPAQNDVENGLGQERTARIASLIGASGGYVTGEHSAKGVGGIWKLEGDNYTSIFSGDNSKTYSVMIASSDVVADGTASTDNPKYLSRIDESGADDNSARWENTMRTDLYLGGGPADAADPYMENTSLHSIRNVRRLIINSENLGGDEAENASPYSLYVANPDQDVDGAHSGAYIRGILQAGKNQFLASADRLAFNRVMDGENETDNYNFEVGDNGAITNTGSVDLATGNSEVHIGRYNIVDNSYVYALHAQHDNTRTAKATIMGDETFAVYGDMGNNDDSIVIAEGGVKSADGLAVSYVTTPTFPVRIGSNAKVDGILAATQLDTARVRAKSLKVGSDDVDAEQAWLNVDSSGIHAFAPSDSSARITPTEIWADNSGISLGYGSANRSNDSTTNAHDARITLTKFDNNGHGQIVGAASSINLQALGSTEDATRGTLKLGSDKISAEMQNNQMKIFGELNNSGVSTNDAHRTVFEHGHVDLADANLRVINGGNTLFSVKGNGSAEGNYPNGDAYGNASIAEYENKLTEKTEKGEYDVAVGGNMVIGNASEGQKYVAVGNQYDPEASINVFQEKNEGNVTQVLTIDTASTLDNEKMTSGDKGSVYIRAGMVEVSEVPADKNNLREANQGGGVVKASRFVANNDASVPSILIGENANTRYDTYMVNPAYTSVMHDIKLTTRGGARLSDILPDFITKGIYVVNNSYKEISGGGDLKVEGKVSNHTLDATIGDTTVSALNENGQTGTWGSPFTGLVAAPQCPPGYGRVITLVPNGFLVAESGDLVKIGDSNASEVHKSGSFYVAPISNDNIAKSVEENKDYDPSAHNPTYNEISAGIDSENVSGAKIGISGDAQFTVNNGNGTTSTGALSANELQLTALSGLKNRIVYTDESGKQNQLNAYVLSSTDVNAYRPMTFQQSTWLKSQVLPIYNGVPTSIGGDSPEGKKSIGWATFMGFLYPYAQYGDIVNAMTGSPVYYSEDDANSIYWNVFPVRRGSLEGIATTYCYFDRSNLFGDYNQKDVDENGFIIREKYVDKYTDMSKVTDESGKVADSEYKERLNDPRLKYKDEW